MFIYSEVEGRDRLVKVDKQEKLVQLAEELGEHNADMVYSHITKAIVWGECRLQRSPFYSSSQCSLLQSPA